MDYLTKKLSVDDDLLYALMNKSIQLITLDQKKAAQSRATNAEKVSYLIEDVLQYKGNGDVPKFFVALENCGRSHVVKKLKEA